MRTILALLAVASLTACTSDCGKEAPLALAVPAPMATPACACAGVPQAAAPTYGSPMLYGAVQPLGQIGVAYGQPGAREYAKAGLMIPPAVIDCLTTAGAKALILVGDTARCVVNGFFPPIEPSQRFVQLVPVQAAPAAAPCAPAAPRAAPCAPPPAAPKACPEPITMVDDPCCPGGVCRMPGR